GDLVMDIVNGKLKLYADGMTEAGTLNEVSHNGQNISSFCSK
ncbi:D-alanine--D-alanine ligase, partial [Lacticaseibacillus paracasei subsp. paracasei Lpp7]